MTPTEQRRFAARVLPAVGAALLLAAMLCAPAQARVTAAFCGPLHIPPAAEPWDFRVHKNFLPIVENAHFTPQVEFLIRGETGNRVGPDLDYTLGRFPNHPRALVAVHKLYKRNSNTRAELLPRPVECYFERAIRFAPNDPVMRMLYADFLIGEKRQPEALQQLETTKKLAAGALITHYNVGLIYLQMKDYTRALEQAHVVESLKEQQGMPGANFLRQELERAGQWREPAPAAAASAASAAGSADAAPAAASAPGR